MTKPKKWSRKKQIRVGRRTKGSRKTPRSKTPDVAASVEPAPPHKPRIPRSPRAPRVTSPLAHPPAPQVPVVPSVPGGTDGDGDDDDDGGGGGGDGGGDGNGDGDDDRRDLQLPPWPTISVDATFTDTLDVVIDTYASSGSLQRLPAMKLCSPSLHKLIAKASARPAKLFKTPLHRTVLLNTFRWDR